MMIKLLSIHIPKTAGTSFYHVLQQVYPTSLSPSLRRKDLLLENEVNNLSFLNKYEVVHGHITFREAAPYCIPGETKVICWLRHPIDRVMSNYNFFKHRLQNTKYNPEIAYLNRHRTNESLLEYAGKEENRNKISKFIDGLELEVFFFIGLMEFFEQDLAYLAQSLDWPPYNLPHLNPGQHNVQIDSEIWDRIAELNEKDIALYSHISAIQATRHKSINNL